jgi:kynurenine formamidase
MKRLIDLTQLFTGEDMPVYPGDSCAKLYAVATHAKDGVCAHAIETGMHVGTHIDAPLHMIDGGAYISDIPVDRCTGKGHLIDVRGKKIIDADCLDSVDLQNGDIVMVWTGWSDKFRDPEYYTSYPAMTDAFGQRLADAKIAMVGMDTPSPDYEPFAVHKILLRADVLIAENLTNLAALQNKQFRIHAYPLKLKAEAAPARIVAEI